MDVRVSMQPFVDFIQNELSKGSGGPQESRGTPLFKVPVQQRESNPKAYDPRSFAFGPYHSNIGLRSDADYIKLQAVTQILGKEKFEKLVSRIEEHEPSIRALYVEGWDHLANIDRRTLSNLLAVDAVTIYAGLCRLDVFQTKAYYEILWTDAILLENQIPLLVIQYAIEGIGGIDANRTLEEKIRSFSRALDPFRHEANRSWQLSSAFDMSRSLLSCIYDELTASSCESGPVSGSAEENERSFNPHDWKIPTASHLRRCGINFRSCYGSFDKITFDNHKGILSLPKISVFDNTERRLLNLVAYEVTSRCATNYYPVLSYLTMMDWLLDDEEDVKVLEDCGVIFNGLGSARELSSMWNKLCVGLPFELTDGDSVVVKDVNRMSQIKWRKWSAALSEKYLEKQPWLMVSLVVAFVLLVLTFLQTLYTIKSYVH